MNEATKKLINAMGATAEMSLIFYRAAINSGANREEAKDLTQAYIGAVMFGLAREAHLERMVIPMAIKDSGDRTAFSTGAVRDMHTGKGRMDLLPWEALIEVSKHCEEGALKYGERNCEKGIPIHSLIDSAFRHLAKYMMGMRDEPHLRAAAWNILFALYMEIKYPELQDIPTRMEEPKNEDYQG